MPISLVRRRAVIAPLVLAGLVGGCASGAPPGLGGPSALPASPSASVGASASVEPAASEMPSVGPTTMPVEALAQPPAATLRGQAVPGGPATGALGSFTWIDEGSDAPWIVPPSGPVATPAGPLDVTFDPPVTASSWIARWAPVTGAGAGDVDTFLEGSGPVMLMTPDKPGAWSLQVESRFGEGRSATWYWRVELE